jgi:hypothetical protein
MKCKDCTYFNKDYQYCYLDKECKSKWGENDACSNYIQQEYIAEMQAKLDKLRKEENGAWWLLPPADRMRKALESIAIHVIYNDPVDANHVLKICKVALTGVNKEN